MARILAISSQVARGHVGLSAIVPALQALGHEVIGLPTVLLSNHPGHPHVAGQQISVDVLTRMFAALEANGWLDEIDAVLTGYLPTVAHVEFARRAIDRVRAVNSAAVVLCDPVLGDEPKGLYIPQDTARAIGDHLLGVAGIATPNAFEASFLAGVRIVSEATATCAAALLNGPSLMVIKSVPGAEPSELLNLVVCNGNPVARARVLRRKEAPHGTGDMLAALVLACRLDRLPAGRLLSLVTAQVDAVLAASEGRNELCLTHLARCFAGAAPWPIESLREDAGAGAADRQPECR